MNKRPGQRGRLACLIVLLFHGLVSAQDQPGLPSPPELARTMRQLQDVPMLMSSQEYEQALRYLTPGVPVLEALSGTDAALRQAWAKALFMKGVCEIELQKYSETIETFEKFITLFSTDPSIVRAKLLLGEAYLYQERWQDILRVIPPLLGMRMLPQAELTMAYQLAAESWFQLEQWETAIPALRWLFLNSGDPDLRMSAVSQLSVCLIRMKSFSDLYKVMPFVHRTQAKYDISLNITMLEEGDNLLGVKRPDQALLLYRLVIPYGQLENQITSRIQQLEDSIRRLKDQESGLSEDTRRLRFLTRSLEDARNKQEELSAYPDYDEELKIRLGDVYYSLKRPEEAIQLYMSIPSKNPGHELAQRAMYSAYMTAYGSEEENRALSIARAYMTQYPGGEFWDDVTLHAAALLVDLERWFEAVEVVDRALEVHPDHASADNLLYMKGYAQFQQSLIRESMATFETLIREHGRSSFRVNAEYWHALGHLFLQQYVEARDEFGAFVTAYKRGPLREDAFYRRGVAEYGLGDFETAKATLEEFVRTYPDSILSSEALAMVGDILASWGQLDEAMAHYRTAVDKAVNMVQADYGTFQQARTLELEQHWQDIIDLFSAYNQKFGDDANYTEATYWMGNAYKQLGQDRKALDLFYDAIVRHGNERRAYGIDFILRDLTAEMSQILGGNAISELALDMRSRLNREINQAMGENKQTLALRLEGLMYDTTPNEELKAAIRSRLMKTHLIELAAPITLVTMGKMGQETGDQAFTRAVYEHFLKEYEDSDLILDALDGLSEAYIQEKRYAEAMDLLKSITDRFPTLPQAAEAYMRIGDIHQMRGETEAAIETYTLILTVKDWRGELWPRALLKIGDSHAAVDQYKEAFGFYQRVYVMYVGYPSQAAEAYLKSAQMLNKLGKQGEASATLKEMLDQASLAGQPSAREARAMMMRLMP